MIMTDKVRENRLRRMAARQGLVLTKSRRRDSRALDYGGYALTDAQTKGVMTGQLYGTIFHLSLDDVEDYLTTDHKE